jgi:Carboxypeptidase regulatory-like domain
MKGKIVGVALVLMLVTAVTSAFGQGTSTASLSGVVADSSGGMIPGATVVVKNNATGVTIQLVTNAAGVFSAPSIPAGTYTVTVTLNGFKTQVVNDIKLIAGTPADLAKITLQVGSLSDTVEVRARTELVQTTATAVSSTVSAQQINNLPLVTQNGMAFISTLPGVDTGGNHSVRGSSVNGLPSSAINITLDGISSMDMAGKELWANIHPKLDQVEEVTVTGAVPGADSSGQGAVTVKWVTRSGGNTFNGSAYEYFRHWDLNSNYYFNTVNNLSKNQIKLNQFGVRQGGPIVKGKLFFFFNEQEFRRPGSQTYTRTILNPVTQDGNFQYVSGGVLRSVPLLPLAGGLGFTSTTDPTVMALLGRIKAATLTEGTTKTTSDPNLDQYVYQGEAGRDEHNPTGRIDYNVNQNHRISGVYNWQMAFQHPDGLNNNGPTFPGLPNYLDQKSIRTLGSYTLRSTLRSNLINEIVGGFLWSPIDFAGPLGPAQFADQGGFALGFPYGLTSGTVSTNMSHRNNSHWDLNNTLTWISGKHSFTFGGSFSRSNTWSDAQTAVPGITFGVDTTSDPANAMFTTGNFPGASTADLNNARSVYALLTGRVTAINGNVRLNEAGQYVYMGKGKQEGRLDEYGTFVQDMWRMTPTLTLNLGVRWQVQLPFHPTNSLYSSATFADICGVSGVGANGKCNLFRPGTTPGNVTTYQQYAAGRPGYNTDWDNVAPSLGVAWRPNAQSGVMRTLLGDPDQATIRAGFAIAYNRESNTVFTGPYNANPGLTVTQNRTAATGLLVRPGETWPVLLRETSRLGPPPFCSASVTTLCMPTAPSYPMAASLSNSVNGFDPNWEVAHTNSWSVGLQRALGKDMAVEVRYVATRNRDATTNQNLNEVVVVENQFANEFILAQANLQANIAAGRGATFAYFGAGTSPLPIYLANFTGNPASLSGDPARYTGTNNWTNATQVSQLGLILPGTPITTAAASLQSNATFRANMLAAGLPANFWVMNPDVASANLTQSIGRTQYDSLQVEVRRRLSGGLSVSGNYTYATRYTFANDTLRQALKLVEDPAGVKHAFKANWTYEIPVGRGRRFAGQMGPWLNGALGGWEFDGVARVQSGSLLNFGNVRLVGMSLAELRSAYKVQFRNNASGVPTVYMLPQDIIDNTIAAFNVSATSATGYAGTPPTGRYLAPANTAQCVQVVRGDCAPRDVFVYGPIFARFDMSVRKTFPVGGRRTFQLGMDVLNVFNAIGFNAVAQASSAATINQVTSAYTDVANTFDPGGRIGQLVFRFSW